MTEVLVQIRTHTEINRQLGALVEKWRNGKSSVEEIQEFCRKARKETGIARSNLISVLGYYGCYDEGLIDFINDTQLPQN